MDHEGVPSLESVVLLSLGVELVAECERLAGLSRRAECHFRVWEGVMERRRGVSLCRRGGGGRRGGEGD